MGPILTAPEPTRGPSCFIVSLLHTRNSPGDEIPERDISAVRYVAPLLIAHTTVANDNLQRSRGEYKKPHCSRSSYTPVAFNAPAGGVPLDDLRKILQMVKGRLRHKV